MRSINESTNHVNVLFFSLGFFLILSSRHMGSSKGADLPQSSYPSTLRRSMASQSNMMPPSDKPPMQYSASSSATGDDNCTIVVYSFCNDEVPYRTKIPSNPVTLKQFKDFLPKKGAFR